MSFVKLDCGILNSTIWIDRPARELFITALLMAEPRELLEPVPQLAIGQLTYTGWVVPPGWYGFVPAAGPGIISRAGLDDHGPLFAAAVEALARLGSPEPDSRSHAFDGRRLVRIDGGFLVLNYIQYREKDATTAERSRRWRERQKRHASRVTDTTTRRDDTPSHNVIRHQAEAEGEAEGVRTESAAPTTARHRPVEPVENFSSRQTPTHALLLKITHGVLDDSPGAAFAELKEAIKCRCASLRVAYDATTVGTALESALAYRAVRGGGHDG